MIGVGRDYGTCLVLFTSEATIDAGKAYSSMVQKFVVRVSKSMTISYAVLAQFANSSDRADATGYSD